MDSIKMKKKAIVKRIVSSFVAVLMLTLFTVCATAANETASIETVQTVKKGEQFTVSLTFTSSESIGSYKATLEYDSDIIEFVSGDFANGGGGLCIVNGWSEQVGTVQTVKLTFEAVKDGSTQLMLTKSLLYSDLGDLLGSPVDVANITVSSQAQTTTTTSSTEVSGDETDSSDTSSQTSDSVTTTTTTITTTTTTTAGQNSPPEQTDTPSDENQSGGQNEQTTTKKAQKPDSSSRSDNSEAEDKEGNKKLITNILLIVGCVMIVALIASGGQSGSGKKKSSGRRKSSSSRSSQSRGRSNSGKR